MHSKIAYLNTLRPHRGLLMHILPRPIRLPPLYQLLIRNLPQLIHLRRTPCRRSLRHLVNLPQDPGRINRIRRSLRIDLDNANTRVLWPTVVCAIFQIPEPCFQRWGVVFANGLAVGYDLGYAADGRPLASALEEGDVDIGVGFEVVGLTGLGVGVEKEVNAAAFLWLM